MSATSIIGVGLCVLWLLGHAGLTFWAGGFEPGSPTANVFVAMDSLISIALAFFIYKRTGRS